jgi:capsular polysaccharide biosynthesis protein
MKRYFAKTVLNTCSLFPGNFLFTFVVAFITKMSPEAMKKAVRLIPFDRARKIRGGSFQLFAIENEESFRKYEQHILEPEAYERIRTPNIVNISKENHVNLLRRKIAIYLFRNAVFSAESDAIIVDGKVYWEKGTRPEAAMTIPIDSDVISHDFTKKQVILYRNQRKIRRFKKGFSLCGVHAGAWAHFLYTYIPKLLSLKQLVDHNADEKLDIFVPSNLHSHNYETIHVVLARLGVQDNTTLTTIDADEIVQCESLYYVSNPSFLCDHSTYVHPSSACISRYTANAVKELSEELWQRVKPGPKRKIYIGRGKGRNLDNAAEVEQYFQSQGFEIVYPHLLSFDEKIQMFGNCTHIAGPISSGFVNFIFAANKVKILGFFNYCRAFDPFLSSVLEAGRYAHSLDIMTGTEIVNTNLNNSYHIPLNEITKWCNDNCYFS